MNLRQTYDKIAKEYGGYNRKWPILEAFLKNKKSVLDIGCGNASYLKDFKGKIIGIVFSIEHLKLAKKVTNKLICGDAVSTPIKPHSSQTIIAMAVIHHLKTSHMRLKMLKSVKEMLKNKGSVALISAWKYDSLKYKRSDNLIKFGKYKRFYHLFKQGELEALAKQAGFKHIESIEDKKNWYVVLRK